MPDVAEVVGHWGYLGVFLVVVLGNIGLPVPEETVLIVAGYLVYAGRLRLFLTLTVGIVSAVVGDNIGYWIGRRVGRPAIERYGHRLGLTRQRLDVVTRFVGRYGAPGIAAARFIPGIRVMAGPVAGAAGLSAPRFVAGNVVGATLYVPYAVGIGYALAYGLESWLGRAEKIVGEVEHLALLVIAVAAALVLARRLRSASR